VSLPLHAGGTAFIQLLPTHLYLVGAALTVVVSFALVTVVPARWFGGLERLRASARVPLPRGETWSTVASLASLGGVVALVFAGVIGSRDPLANPLPVFVWAVWWIGFTYLHAAFGDVWSRVNPWIGAWRLIGLPTVFAYPARLASWPAVAGFVAFGWFELIHPAPTDPAILASLVVAYVSLHFAGVMLMGPQWLRRAETFAVFFRIVAGVSPFARRGHAVEVTPPALGLLGAGAPGASGVAFILAVLATVSFDGFSRTYAWLTNIGVNPLVYPGRTELMRVNTAGLAGLFAVIAAAYAIAVSLGARLGRMPQPTGDLVRLFALALVPIVCGYHFAHYLPVFLVDVQHALRAASDPFARGWDLFGTADLHVITSFLSDASRVYAIWHVQVALIVGAHVAGVVLSHALAARLGGTAVRTALGQLPLLLLMVGYTLLGLWLLSTPAVG
jgi:hypothetical protein